MLQLYQEESDTLVTPTNLRLDEQLCFALYAASNAVTRAYRPLLQSIGLTYPQYLVMLVLWEERTKLPVHEIAERLQLAPHALSPLLARLEEAGLVTRHPGEHDRRVVAVALTGRGVRLQASASRAQFAVVDRTGLCSDELDGLRDQLRDLLDRMNSDSLQ